MDDRTEIRKAMYEAAQLMVEAAQHLAKGDAHWGITKALLACDILHTRGKIPEGTQARPTIHNLCVAVQVLPDCQN